MDLTASIFNFRADEPVKLPSKEFGADACRKRETSIDKDGGKQGTRREAEFRSGHKVFGTTQIRAEGCQVDNGYGAAASASPALGRNPSISAPSFVSVAALHDCTD